MLQTESQIIGELNQKHPKTLTLSAPTSSIQETSSVVFNFYPGYKGIDLTSSDRKIIQSITILFESWQTWQRHILFSGVIHRFGKTQLKNLKTAIESLCHRDFITNCRNVYPMHKVKERQYVRYRDLPKHEKFDAAFSTSSLFAESAVDIKRADNASKCERKRKKHFSKKGKQTVRQKQGSDEGTFRKEVQIYPAISQGIPLQNQSKKIPDSKAIVSGKKVSKKSSMVSLPSVWEMGEDFEEVEEGESDFQSRISQINKPPTEYFPHITSHRENEKFVTTSSKIALNEYMERYDADRNKTAWPTAPQLYKNEKMWSSHRQTVDSTPLRLKELFQKQIRQIWTWVEGLPEHKRMRLLLHLLSISLAQEQKFVADCIREKIKEIRAEESQMVTFPQRVWMKVIDYLNLRDVQRSERVCKAWHTTLTDEDLWIEKCQEIGKKLKIDNIIQLIRNCGDEVPDWRRIYFMLRKYFRVNLEGDATNSVTSDDVMTYLQAKLDRRLKSAATSIKTSIKPDQFGERKKIEFFSSFKSELKLRRDEERLRAKLIREEEESRRREEADRRLQELKRKRRKQVEKIMYSVKPLVSDIKDKDDKRKKKILTQKTFVDVYDTLLTDEELSSASKTVGFFAIDHTEEETQSTKPWIVDNYVPPISAVVALQGHVRPVWCILVHGGRIISGGMDRKVRFWTIAGECYATKDEVAKGGIRSMAIGTHERCRNLYASSWDTTITVLDSITLKTTAVLVGHKDTVSAVAVDTNFIVSCSYDCTVRVWDVKTNKLLRVVSHHRQPLLCLTFKEGLIFSGGADRLLHVTEARTGKLLKTYIGHKSTIAAVKVRKNLIVTGDFEGYVFFWSLNGTDKPVSTVKAHRKKINAVEFSQQRLFTASDDKQVKEWNLFTLKCLRTLQGHSQAVMDVKYKGDYLITCSIDGTVRMWWWLKYKGKDRNASTL